MNPLQDENLRQLLLRDLMSAHQLTHRDVATVAGRSVKTVGHWMEANMRRSVPEPIIAELVRRYPTPWSRRQLQVAA